MNSAKRTLDFLSTEADEIMLKTGGSILSRGCLYNIKCIPLTTNVYKLSLERAHL